MPSSQTFNMDDVNRILDQVHKLSRVLDSFGFGIGLDPLISLFPGGIGDALAALAGLFQVYLSAQLGLPLSKILQMLFNVLVDFLLGLVPVLGDVLDFLYKANLYNAQILDDYVAQKKREGNWPPRPNTKQQEFTDDSRFTELNDNDDTEYADSTFKTREKGWRGRPKRKNGGDGSGNSSKGPSRLGDGKSGSPESAGGGTGEGFAAGSAYAVAAGALAAFAGVFAKLTLDDRTFVLATKVYRAAGQRSITDQTVVTLVRAACFVAMFGCNAAMWTSFTKALNRSPSSAKVTVINNATNFCVTAIFGNWLFDEPLSLQWYFGASLIVAGSVLLSNPLKSKNPKLK